MPVVFYKLLYYPVEIYYIVVKEKRDWTMFAWGKKKKTQEDDQGCDMFHSWVICHRRNAIAFIPIHTINLIIIVVLVMQRMLWKEGRIHLHTRKGLLAARRVGGLLRRPR